MTETLFFYLAISVGFDATSARRLDCLAKYESNHKANATSPLNSNLTRDHGILQINDIWLKDGASCTKLDPYNPIEALKCAKVIIKKQGFSAWATNKMCNNVTSEPLTKDKANDSKNKRSRPKSNKKTRRATS